MYFRLHLFVPWNEVVVLDPVVLSKMSTVDLDPVNTVQSESCKDHDFDMMKPIVLATWKNGFQVGCQL